MSGPAKVALSLRHAMRRWLISLPAAPDRSKARRMLSPGMPAASDRSKRLCRLPFHPRHCHLERMSGPAKVALSLRHAMRRWLISLPAASDRSKRSAGFLSIPGIAIWKGCPDLPRSRCLCDTQCGDGSSLCRLHLIARSDLPASFPSQALPSGKDVRTCQGRAVFATRNAAMAHLSAGCI